MEERTWTSLVSPSMVTSLNVCPAQSYSDAISCPTCRGRTTSPISCRKQAVGSTYWENWREPASLLKTYLRATSPSFDQKLSMLVKSGQQHWRASRATQLRPSSAEPCRSSPPTRHTRRHRLVTLQQRRNELCNILFKDIQNYSHRLNSLLPRQHNPGYQLRHSKKYPLPLVKTHRFKSFSLTGVFTTASNHA